MQDPKEKAKELVERMYVSGGAITMQHAKLCALEAAKVVFKEYAHNYTEDEFFWQKVIAELINY